MSNNFPTIGQYNEAIQKRGGDVFRTLKPLHIIPSRTTPIKVFLFGSGAYAAVFKASKMGKTYALRCFLNPEEETVIRYKNICDHLNGLQAEWKTNCEFLEKEIEIKGSEYPVLKMEWVEGLLINEFVTKHLHDNAVLAALQDKLVAISHDLENKKVGHGDLQCGNIIVTGTSGNFQVRLIDYDGMYVPELKGKESLERGRSEFQHPKRTSKDFNPKMDRFSFWVMLTALEALKFDKELWKEVMQGGFNNLDNFLFTAEDFLEPANSKLFARLQTIDKVSLNYYLKKLKAFCSRDISLISKPELNISTSTAKKHQPSAPVSSPANTDAQKKPASVFILTSNCRAEVLTTGLQKIGTTPLRLDMEIYSGKTVIVTDGKETKRAFLDPKENLYSIRFTSNDATGDTDQKTQKNYGASEKKEQVRAQDETDYKGEQDENRLQKQYIALENEKKQLAEEKKRLEEDKLLLLKRKKSLRRRNMTLLTALVLICSAFLVYNNSQQLFSRTIEESPIVDSFDHEQIIKDLLKAEENRNFNKIYSFYSSSMERYYDDYNPNYSSLKKKYEYLWGITSNAKNNVKRIDKVTDRVYDLHTHFTYYNKKRKKNLSTDSVVRFIFNEQGKIVEIFAREDKQAHTPRKISTSRSQATQNLEREKNFSSKIRDLIKAEEERNFPRILSFYSNPTRFRHLYYPTNKKIKTYYEEHWASTRNNRQRIIDIQRITEYIYHLNSEYSYYDENKEGYYTYRDKILYEFNPMGEIHKTFVLEKDRIYPSQKNGNENIINSSRNKSKNKIPSRYKFSTSIKGSDFELPLRAGPSITSEKIYSCPEDAVVYVIDNKGQHYFKVSVDGNIGYVSRKWLKRNF